MLPFLFELMAGADGWELYQYQNWVDHQLITQAIAAQKGVQLPTYPMQVMSMDRLDEWLELNEQAHQDMAGVIAVPHRDLTDLDIGDPEAVQGWVWDQAIEHAAAHQLLGI
jgi:hypothetical protein